MIDLLIIFL